MTSDSNQFGLALCVLKGEKDAHLILADLLEESGDAANAQFSRSDKKSLRKRFDLTLGLLPAPIVLWLACDFIEHIVDHTRHFGEAADELSRNADAVRELAKGLLADSNDEATAAESASIVIGHERACESIAESIASFPARGDYSIVHRNQKISRLLASFERVARATFRLRDVGRAGERASATAVGQAGKATANRVRDVAALTGYVNIPNRRGWETELRWQAGRAQTLIEELYQSESPGA